MEQDNGCEDSETPEQQNISASPNVAEFIQPLLRQKRRLKRR
jgi:hypothetical protein